MKSLFTTIAIVLTLASGTTAQAQQVWQAISPKAAGAQSRQYTAQPSSFKLYTLNLQALKTLAANAPARERASAASGVEINFPTPAGTIERFKVIEATVMHPALAAKYPEIKSYAGQGIDDPTATIRFSISQRGFHGMVLSGNSGTYYIDPYNEGKNSYMVYSRSAITDRSLDFECLTEEASSDAKGSNQHQRTNDKKLRRYRLALSCNAEYGNIFAGTGTDAQKKANILAQMNITMTRVNGIYERDLAITMQLVANNDALLYYGSTAADPWSDEWNSTTQRVIDNTIGDSNYDIGHNFNTTNGGSAGCIGCVCTSGRKGSAFTGRANPTGDAFDVDYVAHEMGHQFGGFHVQSSTACRSGSGTTEVEPGSGSSIMGYAGICDANVQSNSDAYFNYVNIRDISANIQSGESSGCAQVIELANNPPTANAGPDVTIPKSTAFVLKGQGSDPDGDALTYTWEQNDPENPRTSAAPISTRTVGPMFRSKEGTSNPNRYMPRMSDVVANNLTPTWEVVPSVARTLNFALTVRDNKAGGGQSSDDLMRVTVAGNSGPFLVNSPNTNVSWAAGESQTVTWSVANTNAAPVNCSNVNILLSTDGGYTYPVTLVANTPNDGSQAVIVPNSISSSCRIKIEAVNNIFFDISNANFTITPPVPCAATVPTGLAASNVEGSIATLNWNTVAGGASYDVRYRIAGTTAWTTMATADATINLTSLTAFTRYETQVRSKCANATSAYSTSVFFTTTEPQPVYCTSSGSSIANGSIGIVQVGDINNTSAAANSGYTNYTSIISTNLMRNRSYLISVVPRWSSSSTSEGYAAWIDYNQDGDFTDAGEQIWSKQPTRAAQVRGSFTIPASALEGKTRLRIAMKKSGIPTSCEHFEFGEVEDYRINIQTGAGDIEAPSIPGNISASNITEQSAAISWSASTDNVGVVGYDVSVNGVFKGSTTAISYSLTGLTANTVYTVSVVAKDAAGNRSAAGFKTFSTTGNCLVTLTLNFDEYSEETRWVIENSTGTTVASGGPYDPSLESTTITSTSCLPAGCYSFTIYDSEGDGLCCDYGDGSYLLQDASGATLASGATFEYSETTNFCIGSGSRTDRYEAPTSQRTAAENYFYPNPVQDILTINVPKESITSVKVISLSGSVTYNVPLLEANKVDVSSLANGYYIIVIETTKEVLVKKFIKQ